MVPKAAERLPIAFGPVRSRRLGWSLGINNVRLKSCTYSCIYCQVGSTDRASIRRSTVFAPNPGPDSPAPRSHGVPGDDCEWAVGWPHRRPCCARASEPDPRATSLEMRLQELRAQMWRSETTLADLRPPPSGGKHEVTHPSGGSLPSRGRP